MKNLKQGFEVYTELKKIVQKMNCTIEAVIVEGMRDSKAIRLLGFENDIIKCSSSRFSHTEFVENLSKKYFTITILTDFDKHGMMLNKKLSSDLRQKRVKVNNIYRKQIKDILKQNSMRTIESINKLVILCCKFE